MSLSPLYTQSYCSPYTTEARVSNLSRIMMVMVPKGVTNCINAESPSSTLCHLDIKEVKKG